MSATLDRVLVQIRAVYENKGVTPPALSPSSVLGQEIGLESLDLAEIVVRLENEFGFDPFAEGVPEGVRTIGDLTNLYATDGSAGS
jgi:acyl carrier protein